jgi:LmbE family N-acetylglucosaminyl deacetylase
MTVRSRSDGDLGTILGVFAHPDDEAYLAGGLMATAAEAGRRVVCITATRGELGFPDDDPRSVEERKATRESELAACLEVLGVREHILLDYPDGGCADVAHHEAAARLAAHIDDVRPDTVLTFGPDGQTYHPDHIAVSRWTTLACEQASHEPRLLYAVMTPGWIESIAALVDLDQLMMVPGVEPPTTPVEELSLWFVAEGPVLDRKVRALECQASQVRSFIEMAGRDAYGRLNADETFRDPAPHDWAEG